MPENETITEQKTRKHLVPTIDYMKVYRLMTVPSSEMDKDQIAELLMPLIDKKAENASLKYIKSSSNDFDRDSCKSVMLTKLLALMEKNNLKSIKDINEFKVESHLSNVFDNAIVDEFRRLHGRDAASTKRRQVRLEYVDPRASEEHASPQQLAFLNHHDGSTPLDTLLDKDADAIPGRIIKKITGTHILTPKENEFLIAVFSEPEKPLKAIGESLGYTESRACQNKTSIISKMRQPWNKRLVGKIMEDEGLHGDMKPFSRNVKRTGERKDQNTSPTLG